MDILISIVESWGILAIPCGLIVGPVIRRMNPQ